MPRKKEKNYSFDGFESVLFSSLPTNCKITWFLKNIIFIDEVNRINTRIISFKVFFMRFHFYEVLYLFSLELTDYKSKLLGLRRKSNSPIIRNPLSL